MSLLLLFNGGVIGPIEGEFTVSEANDTLSALVSVGIAAEAEATEAGDAASAAGTAALAGSTGSTETGDAGTATAALAIVAVMAAIEGDDVPSVYGALDIVSSLAATEQGDIIGAASAVDIFATLTVAEEDDTLFTSALMPIWYPRRGGDDEWARYERRQREWEEQLRRIIDRSWRIANGEIDPITFEPIPPPDYSAVTGELISQALTLDRARVEVFIAEQERLQEEEAISILLLAA